MHDMIRVLLVYTLFGDGNISDSSSVEAGSGVCWLLDIYMAVHDFTSVRYLQMQASQYADSAYTSFILVWPLTTLVRNYSLLHFC